MNDLFNGFHDGIGFERSAAREAFVKDRAQRVDVAAGTDQIAFAFRLLRWHITGRPDNLAG